MTSLELIMEYHQAIWVEKNISATDRYFSNTARIHSPIETTEGTEKMKAVLSHWQQAFPDLIVSFEDYICEGNKVVSRWKAHGTQTGDFLEQPATGKAVRYSGISIFELENEKITQYWCEINMQLIWDQLKFGKHSIPL